MEEDAVKRELERSIEMVKAEAGLPEENRKLILDYARKSMADAKSAKRIIKVNQVLRKLSSLLGKPFPEADKKDIEDMVFKIEQTGFQEWTKHDYKAILKTFYKWLKGDGEYYPLEVRWVKPRVKHENSILPEDLITEDEVKRIAECTNSPRDRAFVLLLYESGCRIGELIGMKLKNVAFDEYGAVLRVSGKTGDRRVRVVASATSLARWLDAHPYRDDLEAPLWVTRSRRNGGSKPTYNALEKALQHAADRAGVKRKLYFHLFRHSRATALASKLTEAQMKEHFGWVQSSRMASVYVHLSGRDVDNALLATYGLAKKEEEVKDKFQPLNCARCNERNSPISKFCHRCGSPLDAGTAIKLEEKLKSVDAVMLALMKDPEFKEKLLQKMISEGVAEKLV